MLHNQIQGRLSNNYLFNGIDDAVMTDIASRSVVKDYRKGHILFIHGDEAESAYLVAGGWIKLFRETIGGEEAVIDVLNEDCLFGEAALFQDKSYPYGAEVIEHSQLIQIPLSAIEQQIRSNPKLALNMLESMSQHRNRQNRELEHRTLQNAPQRIACFLLRLCKADGRDAVRLFLPYDKTLIAARLGMKPETFSRALNRLREDQDLGVNGPELAIKSVKGLAEYACSVCSSVYPCEDIK